MKFMLPLVKFIKFAFLSSAKLESLWPNGLIQAAFLFGQRKNTKPFPQMQMVRNNFLSALTKHEEIKKPLSASANGY